MKFILILIKFAIPVLATNPHETLFRALHSEPTVVVPPEKVEQSIQEQYLDQQLNPLDKADDRTFKMKYYSMEDGFVKGGPVIIILGGEYEITPDLVKAGIVHDIVKAESGCLYYVEHRFYGKSSPTQYLRIQDLRYLKMSYILEDVLNFIHHLRTINPDLEESKIILVGSGYAGLLVAMSVQAHPTLIAGGWASSAPIFQEFENKGAEPLSGDSIVRFGGQTCSDKIQATFKYLATAYKANDTKSLLKAVNICNDFNPSLGRDQFTLDNILINIFTATLQNSKSGQDIEKMCKIVTEGADIEYSGFKTYVQQFLGLPDSDCFNASFKALDEHIAALHYTNSSMRQWYYQECHDLPAFTTQSISTKLFHTKTQVAEMFDFRCLMFFYNSYNMILLKVKKTEVDRTLNAFKDNLTGLYLSQGGLDPLRGASVLIDTNHSTVIPNVGRSQDFSSLTDEDSEEMKVSKFKLDKLINEWSSSGLPETVDDEENETKKAQ